MILRISRRELIFAGLALCAAPAFSREDRINTLWDKIGRRYLSNSLWRQQWAYDAGHVLLPMMLLACVGRTDWLRDFQDHFERFLIQDDGDLASCPIDHEANRLHYLYFVSQFCKRRPLDDALARRLADKLLKELVPYFTSKPVWGWEPPMFEGGIKQRVRWKLERDGGASPSYYSAIFDVDLFTLCALCDLSPFANNSDRPHCINAAALAGEILTVRGMATGNGGWLFQPGVWWDHPDYAYAGYHARAPGLQPARRRGIAEDSSHSHRFPIFLKSIQAGPVPEASRIAGQALEGLAVQFVTKVLVPSSENFPAPTITNYMDGWNGLYRYAYETSNANFGYGPYQLSGILAEGWWGLLKHPTIQHVWDQFAEQFPLSKNVLETYVGPNTTHPRHSLVAWPAYFTNGFAELSVRTVSELGHHESD